MEQTRNPATGARAALLVLAALFIIACVYGGAAQVPDISLGGFFELTVVTTQTDPATVERMSIDVSMAIDGFTAQVSIELSSSLFDALNVSVSGSIGEVALNSSVAFNPSTLSFLSWQTGASFSLLDLDITDVLYVTSPQTASYNQFTASGTSGDLSFQASVKIGVCPLVFWEASVCVDWPWEDCETNLGACMQTTDSSGVQSLDLTMTDYVLFENLLGFLWSLDVALSFTPDEKTLAPTLKLQPDWFICPEIELLSEVSAGPSIAGVEAILIYGIRGECALGDNTTIRFAESLADGKNGAVTGKAEYFEVIGVSGGLPSCCESAGSYDVAAYFDRSSGSLFDLGLVAGSFDVQIAPNFAFAFEAEFPTSGSGWQLLWSLRVIW